MEYVNPVMEGIKTYRAVDDIFRARRQDERQAEKDTYDRNRQQQQDAMATESHNLQTTATKEALRKIEEERLRTNYKALQFKLNAIADGDLGPDALGDDDYKLIDADPALAPYVKDTEKRQQVVRAASSLLSDIPEAAGMNGPRSPEAYGRIIESLNAIYPSRNTTGGPQYKRIVDVRMRPDGKFAIEAEFERTGEDGKVETYIAPFTKGKSADPNDPVNFYSMDEVLPKIVGNAKILHALDKTLETRRIALGDDEPIKEAVKMKKEAKALKAVGDAIEKLPDGPAKDALSGVLPSMVAGNLSDKVGEKLIDAATPKQEEIKWEDNVLGKDGKPYKVAYNKAGKEIKRERQYVKPDKDKDGGGKSSKDGPTLRYIKTDRARRADGSVGPSVITFRMNDPKSVEMFENWIKSGQGVETFPEQVTVKDELGMETTKTKTSPAAVGGGSNATPAAVPARPSKQSVYKISADNAEYQKAKQAGYSDQQIRDFFKTKGINVELPKAPEPKKKGFLDEMSEVKAKRQAELQAERIAAQKKADVEVKNGYVTAYNKKGEKFRTLASNAVFNQQTGKWELRG